MVVCVNRNLVTGMPPSVSKAVTNQNDLVTGKVLYFSLWKIRRVIPAKTSLADNPDLKSDNRNNRSFSVDGLRLGITYYVFGKTVSYLSNIDVLYGFPPSYKSNK
jgi:hypothetical protein